MMTKHGAGKRYVEFEDPRTTKDNDESAQERKTKKGGCCPAERREEIGPLSSIVMISPREATIPRHFSCKKPVL
jgi:hypothetical protein